ncbi:MAG TPA: S24/S26 family peptidase [Syntrophomonadaceae bacterium]|nr:S24/S26 family peptidase [Syntrophomonadaceae bacterium]
MGQVSKIKAVDLFPFISELIEGGKSARILVSGSSMTPFLRDQTDSVEFSKVSFTDIARGDIVLIQRVDGAYVMHRVYRKRRDCFYIIGDAQEWIEGPLNPDQLVALVTAIWRKDKRIPCSNLVWRLLCKLWLYLRPFRYFIFRVYGFLRRRIKRIKKSSK